MKVCSQVWKLSVVVPAFSWLTRCKEKKKESLPKSLLMHRRSSALKNAADISPEALFLTCRESFLYLPKPVLPIFSLSFFNFSKCIHQSPRSIVPRLLWIFSNALEAWRAALIKNPVSIRLCKSDGASTPISRRLYPCRIKPAPETGEADS